MQIRDVTLSIDSKLPDGTRKVTVGYKLVFAAGEAGTTYRVAITLHGEDLAGDDETASQGPPNPLYTFWFGSGFVQLPYTTVTAQTGEKTYATWRNVPTDTLDEDPGSSWIKIGVMDWLEDPHGDELYARVVASNEARSPTQKFAFPI